MEIIHSILFSFKCIFSYEGIFDIYYLFSIFALWWYAYRRHEKLKVIVMCWLPLVILGVGIHIISSLFGVQNYEKSKLIFSLIRLLFNITIMVFFIFNAKRMNMFRFLSTIVFLHFILTVSSIMLPNSRLWNAGGADAFSTARLQLLYTDQTVLSFASGFCALLIVLQIEKDGMRWQYISGIIVLFVDMILTKSITGTVVTSVIVFLVLLTDLKKFVKIRIKFVTGCLLLIVYALGFYFGFYHRIISIFWGEDIGFDYKIIRPWSRLLSSLKETKYIGKGFGSVSDGSNAFLDFFSETGVAGIVFVTILMILMLRKIIKFDNKYQMVLVTYVFIMQFLSGNIYDPMYFVVYGFIISNGNDFYQKKQDSVAIKPVSIAMLGHKRIPSREGGVEIVVEELSTRLAKDGYKVTAYSRRGDSVAGQEFNIVDYESLKEYNGVKIVQIPVIKKRGYAAVVYSFLSSVKIIPSDYDVVHYHAEGPCAFLWIPYLFGFRTVVTIHGLDWQREKWNGVASLFIRFGEWVAASFADEIIVLSKHAKQYFWDKYHRKTILIPNGVNQPNVIGANIISNKWGLTKDGYILFLGRIVPEKGIHYLIEAFKGIDTKLKLVIAGGSSNTMDYYEEVKTRSATDSRIIFTNHVQGEILEELYSNAYLYVLPSDVEGMPISLLEAMSYGNCCLTSDIPECTDIVREYGESFMAGDIDSLKEKLENLINNRERVMEYKEKTSDYVLEKYNWDIIVKETENIYDRIRG